MCRYSPLWLPRPPQLLMAFLLLVIVLTWYPAAMDAAATPNSVSLQQQQVMVIEHPVFFYMPGLLQSLENETAILQGLNDLRYNNYSRLHFLYSGRVSKNYGVAFTHALISRFPNIAALNLYYDVAITDIARQMKPWLEREYGVDYEALVPSEQVIMDGLGSTLTFHVTFVLLRPNVSKAIIDNMIESFLGLSQKLDYVIQLTAGANLYLRESYRTMSHAFSAYLPSVEALEEFEQDPSLLYVLEEIILPMASSTTSIAMVPFTSNHATL